MHNIAICRQSVIRFQEALIIQFKRINYCNINFRSFNVSNYFSLKNVTALSLKADVVHCPKVSCDKTQSYIGRTKRHLAVRVQEHLSVKLGKSTIHENISSYADCHSCSNSNYYAYAQANTS